jgi:outer membrane murein-binding lipoprotein Lpp
MPFEREDVTSIIGGVFDLNAKLARISEDVAAIRRLLEEDDGEEEEAEEG